MGAISLTRSIAACAVLVAAAAVVAVAGFIPASAGNSLGLAQARINRIQPRPFATVLVAGDATAIFAAVNTNGSGSGIIGQSGPSLFGPAAGAGVFGIFNQSSGVGEGILGFSQNGAGVVAENFGGSQAALYAQNFSAFAGPAMQALSNGNAVVGTSNNTNAVVGVTNAPGGGVNSAVLGEDMANDGLFNNGVTGTTTSDGWGVQGTSTNGALGGVEGVATSATGVEGFSSSNVGVLGVGNISSNPGSIGGDVGVKGTSTNANGVYGFSTNRNAGAFENNNGSFFTLFVQADNAGGFPFGASNTSTGASMTLDPSGNLSISGKITTSGSCSVGCSVARHPLMYTPAQSLPTMEDFGEAQLVNGQAYVRLDSAYANVIDRQSNYLVFITPEGDSNGVYVTQKTASGFLVRENRGGHSALAFSYRIVAKPFAT
ncbi:MAG TPA: hypothetical protein VKR99_05315, partial [Candidatus Eremiobacteraceae bacterium]|nr:hypothetical protein [Candidatus Eremiobacteraceae bacterium]